MEITASKAVNFIKPETQTIEFPYPVPEETKSSAGEDGNDDHVPPSAEKSRYSRRALELLNKDTYFFSNFAFKTVFDMMANGAEGKAQEGLLHHSHKKPLHQVNQLFPLTVKFLTETGKAGGPSIKVSTRCWVHQSVELKEKFKEEITKWYKTDESGRITESEVFSPKFMDTEALKEEVNIWGKDNTGGLVDQLIGSSVVGINTRLIIAAALDFEAEWNEPLEDAGIRKFHLPSRGIVEVPFMTTKGKHYVKQFKNYKVLSIPFKQHQESRLSMLFYLPDDIDDYKDLQYHIGLFETAIMDLEFPKEQVQVGDFFIPKFKLKIGGPLTFPVGSIETKEMVHSSSADIVTHKGTVGGFIEINERGTRAAGVTTCFIHEKPKETQPAANRRRLYAVKMTNKTEFVANRPFLFFIRDNEFGRMLFSGGITDPIGASFEKK